MGSGSRGSPWTLEPVQKEVRKLPHAGPSLGVPSSSFQECSQKAHASYGGHQPCGSLCQEGQGLRPHALGLSLVPSA